MKPRRLGLSVKNQSDIGTRSTVWFMKSYIGSMKRSNVALSSAIVAVQTIQSALV